MNKTLIIVLAVCLISVHGFVKRDAPVTESAVGDFQKNIKELPEYINKQAGVINEKLAEILKIAQDAIENLKTKPEAPKA